MPEPTFTFPPTTETATTGTADLPASGRYRLLDEIARGGMGAVYRATDTVLGREVAVKVLQERFAADSRAARRFLDEARITGLLQHPGIPPVHDLGTLSDGRPFLAMKLVKGQTLDAMLKHRARPEDERGRFVAVFEQICHAVGYAHAHDVIHRDLKPANVMVGAHGEVQVMDWGLAKVLTARPSDADYDPDATTGTIVHSQRDSDGSETQAGTILGTLAYMPPEQAIGAVGKVDRRSDVFGLGAILAVILTGKPPFEAGSTESLRVEAAQGNLDACFARLNACGAEPDLVALCKRCLSPKPADRPGDANEVVRAVADLRGRAEERARQAELDSARAEVQTREQRKRWRTLLVAVGALVLVLALGIVGTAIGLMRAEHQLAEAGRQQALANRRLAAYTRAVDTFANEAPEILAGHPLGAAPTQELIQLSLRLDREAREAAGAEGLTAHGELSAVMRQINHARGQGFADDALKIWDRAYQLAQELVRTSLPDRVGANTRNLAVVIGQRAAMYQWRGEMFGIKYGPSAKAREAFAEAVRLQGESLALLRRVVEEPQMRDVPPGEAMKDLASTFSNLAQTHRASVQVCSSAAQKQAALSAAREAARQAEELFASGLAKKDLKEWRVPLARLHQALASLERARAADGLEELAEADQAFQRSFDLFSALVKDTPNHFLHRIEFAKMAAEQGKFLLHKMNDGKRAQSAYAAAVEHSRHLAQSNVAANHLATLIANHSQAGLAARKAGDGATAQRHFAECIPLCEAYLRGAQHAYGSNPNPGINGRIRLMMAQAHTGDHVAAAKNAATVRAEVPKDPSRLMLVAETLGWCAGATEDAKLKRDYLDRAFESLTRAVEQGYANLDVLEGESDPVLLTTDPRFAPLLERVRENARAARAVAERSPPPIVFPPPPARVPDDPLVGRWVLKEERFLEPDMAFDYTRDGNYTYLYVSGGKLEALSASFQRDGNTLTFAPSGGQGSGVKVTLSKLTEDELERAYADGRKEAYRRAPEPAK